MNAKKFLRLTLALLMGLVLVSLSACSSKPVLVEGAERDQILAFAAPMGENLFDGLKKGDYATFSRDFSPEMKDAMPESEFFGLIGQLTQIAPFNTQSLDHVEKTDQGFVVIYKAEFDKDIVMVHITFLQQDPHLINGVWFDLPYLLENF